MRTLRNTALPRWLIAGAMPFMFLFMAVVPANAAAPGSVIATKDCFPKLVRPGGTVQCIVTITNLGRAAISVKATDILAGGGLYPDTTLAPFGAPNINQLNRQEYVGTPISIPPLSTISATLTVIPFQTRALCINSFYANLVNEIHIDLASAPGVHIATARASFSVSCNAPRIA